MTTSSFWLWRLIYKVWLTFLDRMAQQKEMANQLLSEVTSFAKEECGKPQIAKAIVLKFAECTGQKLGLWRKKSTWMLVYLLLFVSLLLGGLYRNKHFLDSFERTF